MNDQDRIERYGKLLDTQEGEQKEPRRIACSIQPEEVGEDAAMFDEYPPFEGGWAGEE